MKYYLSKPMPEEQVPAKSLEDLIKVHGSYDAFNEKLQSCCNLPEQIEAFERFLNDDEKEYLSNYNVTLYSGRQQQEVITGVSVQYDNKDLAALATKVNGISYIAIDTDMLVHNPREWDDVLLRSYLVQTITHEITHLDQMLRGDLDITPTAMVWKGKSYSHDAIAAEVEMLRQQFANDANLYQYHFVKQQLQFPWEIEAYGRTLELINIDEGYPAPEWNELMHSVQKTYREKFLNKACDENVH